MDRFCPNCGTRLEEGIGTCPFCGTSAGIGGGKGPKNTKKYAAIGGGVIAALAVVFLLVRMLSVAGASPSEEFIRVHREALDFSFLEKTPEMEFSTDMTLSMGVDNAFLNAYFRQISLDWKLDVSEDTVNTLLDLVWSGAPLISAQFTYEDGQFGLYVPEASEKYYLFDIQEWYEKDGADFAQLEALRQSGLSPEEWQKLWQTFLDIILETINDDNLMVERNQSVLLPQLGEKVKADCYTFRAEDNERALEDLFCRLADALEQNEELRSAMRVFWDQYYPAVVLGVDYDEDLDEYLNEMAAELREDAKEMAHEMAEDGFYVQAYIRDGKLCYERIAWEVDDGENAFAYESGKSGMMLYLDDDGDSVVSLTHKKADKNAGQWVLASQSDWDDVAIIVDYEMDPEQSSILKIPYGTYTLTLQSSDYNWQNDMAITLTVGPGEDGGSDHTLTMSGEGLMEESGLDEMGVTEFFFTLHTTDESSDVAAPSAPTIQVHDEEDLEELIEGFDQLMYLLSGQLAGL